MSKNSLNRDALIGRLHQMKEREYRLRVYIDTLCKNIIDIFSPMDYAMNYVLEIDVKRLNTQVKDVGEKKRELDSLIIEIKALESDLGEN